MSEILRFCIFSGLAAIRTILEIFLWRWLVKIFEKSPKSLKGIEKFKLNQYSAAHAVSFVASVIASYYLNYYITFSDTDESGNAYLLVKFILVSLLTLGISVLAINILTTNKFILRQSKRFSLVDKHWPLIAKLITIGITMVINYLGYKLFVFLV